MDKKIESLNTFYAMNRAVWRDWLTENFEKADISLLCIFTRCIIYKRKRPMNHKNKN